MKNSYHTPPRPTPKIVCPVSPELAELPGGGVPPGYSGGAGAYGWLPGIRSVGKVHMPCFDPFSCSFHLAQTQAATAAGPWPLVGHGQPGRGSGTATAGCVLAMAGRGWPRPRGKEKDGHGCKCAGHGRLTTEGWVLAMVGHGWLGAGISRPGCLWWLWLALAIRGADRGKPLAAGRWPWPGGGVLDMGAERLLVRWPRLADHGRLGVGHGRPRMAGCWH